MPHPSEESHGSNPSWFDAPRFSLALAVLVLASFWSVATGEQSFVHRDFGIFGYPLAHHNRVSFWAGEVPLWNPLNQCGIPYLAQWNTMFFYPGALLYYLAPMPWSFNFFCVAHVYLAGLGMYFLMRHWTRNHFSAALAGVAFSFNGLVIGSIMMPHNVAAFALAPWILFATRKALADGRGALTMAVLAGASQMLTGAVEPILATWLLASAIAILDIYRRRAEGKALIWRHCGRFLLLVGLITLVSAVQLFPTLQMIARIGREDISAAAWATSFNGWVNLILPLFEAGRKPFGLFLNQHQLWAVSYYAGGLPLMLGIMAAWKGGRGSRILLAIALFAIAAAAGNNGFLYPALSGLLPLELMRYPVKFMIFPTIVLPMLAALGWAAWERENPDRRLRLLGTGIGIMTVLLLFACFLNRTYEVTMADRMERDANLQARIFFLGLGCVGLFALANRRPDRTTTWLQVGLVLVVVWADLRSHSPNLTATVNASIWNPPPPMYVMSGPQPRFGEGRLYLTPEARFRAFQYEPKKLENQIALARYGRLGNLNLLEGYSKFFGFTPLNIPEEYEIRSAISPDPRSVNPSMAAFLGFCQIAIDQGGLQWRPSPSAMPLITGGQAPLFLEKEQRLKFLRSDFDPGQTVVLDPADRAMVKNTNLVSVRTELTHLSPHELIAAIDAPAPSLAVIAQTHYDNWSAYVDDRPVPIIRANHAYQAVAIPAGKSTLALRYEDRAFTFGWIGSLIGLAITFALGLRQKQPAPAAKEEAESALET